MRLDDNNVVSNGSHVAHSRGDLSLNRDDGLYKAAVNKFNAGDYESAINLFQALNIQSSANDYFYIKCLAGSFHANKNYQSAYFWYQYAHIKNPKVNVDCLYYSGLTKFEQHDFAAAETLFNEFLSAKDVNQYVVLIKHAKNYLEIINFKKEKTK